MELDDISTVDDLKALVRDHDPDFIARVRRKAAEKANQMRNEKIEELRLEIKRLEEMEF